MLSWHLVDVRGSLPRVENATFRGHVLRHRDIPLARAMVVSPWLGGPGIALSCSSPFCSEHHVSNSIVLLTKGRAMKRERNPGLVRIRHLRNQQDEHGARRFRQHHCFLQGLDSESGRSKAVDHIPRTAGTRCNASNHKGRPEANAGAIEHHSFNWSHIKPYHKRHSYS